MCKIQPASIAKVSKMKRLSFFATRAVIALAPVFFLSGAARAQPAVDFYKAKQIEMYLGSSVGGGYDQYGRLLGRHMAKHIPGHPQFVFKNMTGGGGRQAINYVYNVAPSDGTSMGTTLRTIPFDPLYGESQTKIDALKMGWIGSLNSEVSVCVAWHSSPFKTLEDTLKSEILMGASGPTSNESINARLLNVVAGTKFKLIQGYPGSTEVHLAIERGEVHGRCGFGWDSIVSRYKEWLDEKKIHVLVQLGLQKHPDIPEVPSVLDLVKTVENRQLSEFLVAPNQMGRPFFTPPGVPLERLQILRKAFDETTRDPLFLADAKRQGMEISAMTGEEVRALVQSLYETPPNVVEIGKKIASGG
jgi:tripartite-type tricarboxylate transporter receptor subunit TctC